MCSAKDIHVAPINAKDANAFVKRFHYSGKVVNNSQLHLGVFLDGKLEGAMQFGPSMDKRKIQGLVADTRWNDFIELNRMAFSDRLPRNSESRALSIAFRMIRKHYPHIEWVISFADGAQCGDGTIYRASGFVLTGIKKNTQIVQLPDGTRESRLSLTDARRPKRLAVAENLGIEVGSASTLKPFLDAGAKIIPGFQFRYIYFLNKAARERLNVPVIPFSRIAEMGARMYKGQKIQCV